MILKWSKLSAHISVLCIFFPILAEIVGGVIGTLSLVLVILLVLLAVKWYKERRRRDNKNRFMEVQNPAYRNSTEFRQSRTEPCYNYMDV